jgi:hypothetical protein
MIHREVDLCPPYHSTNVLYLQAKMTLAFSDTSVHQPELICMLQQGPLSTKPVRKPG